MDYKTKPISRDQLRLIAVGVRQAFGCKNKLRFDVIDNKDHLATFEIGYHEEGGLSEKGENVFHIHEYSQSGIDYRGKARPMTPEEINTYKHLFKGISQAQIDAYLDMYRRRFL